MVSQSIIACYATREPVNLDQCTLYTCSHDARVYEYSRWMVEVCEVLSRSPSLRR
jgi:hypothetical protein